MDFSGPSEREESRRSRPDVHPGPRRPPWVDLIDNRPVRPKRSNGARVHLDWWVDDGATPAAVGEPTAAGEAAATGESMAAGEPAAVPTGRHRRFEERSGRRLRHVSIVAAVPSAAVGSPRRPHPVEQADPPPARPAEWAEPPAPPPTAGPPAEPPTAGPPAEPPETAEPPKPAEPPETTEPAERQPIAVEASASPWPDLYRTFRQHHRFGSAIDAITDEGTWHATIGREYQGEAELIGTDVRACLDGDEADPRTWVDAVEGARRSGNLSEYPGELVGYVLIGLARRVLASPARRGRAIGAADLVAALFTAAEVGELAGRADPAA